MITQELVKSLFDYNENTGIFTRKVTVATNAKAGQILNTKNSGGYLLKRINTKSIKVHRLAWLYVYGELPKDTISQMAVKDLGIELITSYTNCKKRDLIHLKKFKCSFVGRLSTAIGKTYKIKEVIEAVNEEEATKKLYDKYEHITGLIIK